MNRRESNRTMTVAFVAALCAGASMISVASAEDWSRYRGPSGSGVSVQRGLPLKWDDKTNIVWKVDLPGPGTSSPILYGDNIYLTCYTGYATEYALTGRGSGAPGKALYRIGTK